MTKTEIAMILDGVDGDYYYSEYESYLAECKEWITKEMKPMTIEEFVEFFEE